MEAYTINPLTGRRIKVGSALHKSLVEKRILSSTKIHGYRRAFEAPLAGQRVPAAIDDFPVDRSETPWGLKKPASRPERRRIKAECGESCFLVPDIDPPKFPVCNKQLPCTYNCRGIKAAAARAGEWKYKNALEKAKTMAARLDCYKTKK